MPAAVALAAGAAVYPFSLGLVAAFNPCGFPLLPAYLVPFVGAGRDPLGVRLGRALLAGAFVTAGFVVVFAALGTAVEGGMQLVLGWVPWVMIPFGALLAAAGVAAVAGHPVRLPASARVGRRLRGDGPAVMAAFGVSYAVASLGCALPLFLAGVSSSFTRAGFGAGLRDVVAYAAGMGLVLAVLAVAVAMAGASAARRLRAVSRWTPLVGGVMLTLSGAYLVYYWASYLADPLGTPGLVRVVDRWQASLSSSVSAAAGWVGLAAAAAVVGVLVFTALKDRPAPGAVPVSPMEVEHG